MDSPETTLFVPLKPEEMLAHAAYYPLHGQILFRYQDQWVVTQISPEKTYTHTHYALLPEGAPYQLINGKLIFMASPLTIHQQISMTLSLEIGQYIKTHKLGKLFAAPLDVHFDDANIFQPDVLFVSVKRSNIIQKWIMGAPDFVVEIVSPRLRKADTETKLKVYGKYEVVEYWIVYPEEQQVEVYQNHKSNMQLVQTAFKGNTIQSLAIEGFALEVDKIFE